MDYTGGLPSKSQCFDLCEGWWLAALDWGAYGVITRLKEDLQFRSSPHLTVDTLEEGGREAYERASATMERHFAGGGSPWDRRLRKC